MSCKSEIAFNACIGLELNSLGVVCVCCPLYEVKATCAGLSDVVVVVEVAYLICILLALYGDKIEYTESRGLACCKTGSLEETATDVCTLTVGILPVS